MSCRDHNGEAPPGWALAISRALESADGLTRRRVHALLDVYGPTAISLSSSGFVTALRESRAAYEAEVDQLRDQIASAEDSLAHIGAFYTELVALILHGDFKHPVDLSPGTGTGVRAMREVERLRALDAVQGASLGHAEGVAADDAATKGPPLRKTDALVGDSNANSKMDRSDVACAGHGLRGHGTTDEGPAGTLGAAVDVGGLRQRMINHQVVNDTAVVVVTAAELEALLDSRHVLRKLMKGGT